ncbi:MAG: M20 family peptidase [Gammaproteobacteria bacterium]
MHPNCPHHHTIRTATVSDLSFRPNPRFKRRLRIKLKIIATLALVPSALLAAPAPKNFASLQMQDVAAVAVPVDADGAAKRLSKAITFPTVSHWDRKDFDEKAFNNLHQFLADSFPTVNRKLKREIFGKPRNYSLLYTWKGKNPSLPPLLLMAHQDVVPVSPGTEKQWQHAAFSGDIADGYIWGRGSLDDKIMMLAILEAVEMHLKKGFKPARTIYIAFGQDEEVGGSEGAKRIAEVMKARGVNDIGLVLDEGLPLSSGLFPGITGPLALIGTAEKGSANLELKAESKNGNSAMPPAHSNIGILAQAITRLEANPFPYRITRAVRDQFRFLGPELPEAYRPLLAEVVLGDEHNRYKKTPAIPSGGVGNEDSPVLTWLTDNSGEQQFIDFMLTNPKTAAMLHTTTAVTMTRAGSRYDVMPPNATAVVNFRTLQGDTVHAVVERVKKIIADDRVKVSALSTSYDPSPVTDPHGKEYKLLEKTIRQIWGAPDLIVAPYLSIGRTDATYFAASIAKNVLRFSPVRVESAADLERWHGVNERVSVTEYAKSIGFFHQFIANAQGL